MSKAEVSVHSALFYIYAIIHGILNVLLGGIIQEETSSDLNRMIRSIKESKGELD